MRRQLFPIVWAASALACAASATAQVANEDDDGPAVSVSLGHTVSNNLSRTDFGGRGYFNSLGLDVDYAKNTRRTNLEIGSNIEYRKYSEELLGEERVGTARLYGDIDIVSDRLNWFVQETLTDGQTNAFLAEGPLNRENVNLFDTGPRFEVPISRRMGVTGSAIYSKREFENSEQLSSTSDAYTLGLFRQIRSTARVGLEAARQDVEYDLVTDNYTFESVILFYSKELASGSVNAGIGTNRLIIGEFETDGPLLQFGWTRALTGRSRLSIDLSDSYTDSGSLLNLTANDIGASGVSLPNDPLDPVLTTSPVQETRLDTVYEYDGRRTGATLSLSLSQEEFQTENLTDRQVSSLRIVVNRQVSTRMNISLFIWRAKRDYQNFGGDDSDTEDRLQFERTLGRKWSLGLEFSQYDRGGLTDFTERRYQVRLTYVPTN
jgi:hypothetical protein